MRWRSAALVGVLVMCGGGCGVSPPQEDAAAQAATAFHRAADTGDRAAACALLAPPVRTSVSEDSSSCEEGIAKADLPRAGAVRSTAAYGRRAQVRMAGDVVFLTAENGGWRIWAAGCTPGNNGSYDCAVHQ